MHFHFEPTAAQILWTLTFAAELVLLVVLLGRDRARRFPIFTTNIVLMALILLITRLLFGRMSNIAASTIFLVVSNVAMVVSWLVVVEMARRAFAGASRRAWATTIVIVLAIAATVLALWGPWPAWRTLASGSRLAVLRTMQMTADKGGVLGSLLDIELGLLVLLFGRRFKAGWRSHPQLIVIGLSTQAMAELAVRASWQAIALHTTIHSRADYEHAISLEGKLYHGNNVVFLCVLVWWIVCLWIDEPGSAVGQGARQQGMERATGAVADSASSRG